MRGPIRNGVEYALARFVLASLRFTPVPVAHALARLFRQTLRDHLLVSVKRAVEENQTRPAQPCS